MVVVVLLLLVDVALGIFEISRLVESFQIFMKFEISWKVISFCWSLHHKAINLLCWPKVTKSDQKLPVFTKFWNLSEIQFSLVKIFWKFREKFQWKNSFKFSGTMLILAKCIKMMIHKKNLPYPLNSSETKWKPSHNLQTKQDFFSNDEFDPFDFQC